MQQSKIEKIYEAIVNGQPLTIQALTQIDLTSEDIRNLVEQKILKQITPNKFELSSIRNLYNYGVKLLLLRDFKYAYQCFLKCFELDNLNRDYCLQVMLCELRLGKIAQAFEHFPHLEQISEEKDIYDNNLYLYLFNLLTKCPEEYVERVKDMDYDSYLFPADIRVPFKEEQNNIRQSITKNKVKNALRIQNNIIASKPRYSVSDEVLKELIIRLINLESRFKSQILEFAKNKDYHRIISFLYTKSRKRYLTNVETFIRLICESIINISENRVVPPTMVDNTDEIYIAITGNNFELALTLEKMRLKHYEQNPNESVVYILLTQINELIYELEQLNLELKEQTKTFVKM